MSVALAIAIFATAYVPITAGHVGRVIAALGPFLIDEVLASESGVERQLPRVGSEFP